MFDGECSMMMVQMDSDEETESDSAENINFKVIFSMIFLSEFLNENTCYFPIDF